ncbi:SGNH hydrolase-type esterase domain-containing protein [Biscogniauxia mediterranea]|nr:SGNH hydrolase-type esterase domain-containing protein [Biscogniauxia mediterranea]
MLLLRYSLACASLLQLGLAAPMPSPEASPVMYYKSLSPSAAAKLEAAESKILLRTMPLGASITFGEHSSDGNGYRKPLRDKLVSDGFGVDMVGNNPGGTMEDNQTEGYPGFTIDQVHAKAKISVPQYKPNLVLVNVGLNDCFQNVDTANAGTRLRSMLDDVYADSPNAMVLLSTLITNADASIRTCIADINRQYADVARSLRLQGKRIALADMQPPSGPTLDDLAEGSHPNDQGYEKMAEVWFQWIELVSQQGLLVKADPIS